MKDNRPLTDSNAFAAWAKAADVDLVALQKIVDARVEREVDTDLDDSVRWFLSALTGAAVLLLVVAAGLLVARCWL